MKKIFLVFTLSLFFNALHAQQEKKTLKAKEITSSKYCFDDTYGRTGMKLEITLFSNGHAQLEFLKNGVVTRKGNGKWTDTGGSETSTVYLSLSNGTLTFTSVKSLLKQITMLIDTRNNQYNLCF